MGVDLTLLPLMYDAPLAGAIWPHVRLPLERRRELWEEIVDAEVEKPFGQMLATHDDERGYIEVSTNPYDAPLTYATAGEMFNLLSDWTSRSNDGPWTNAAIAYLGELPVPTRVVLWWH